MTTNLPDFTATRTVTDLAALNATYAAERPHLAQSPIKSESNASRALRAAAAVVAVNDVEASDDLETAVSDHVADLRHLIDHLGLDWDTVVWRAAAHHRDEIDA